MKIYTYNNGEKAIFINDKKTVISNKEAQMIEHFDCTINDFHPGRTAFEKMTDEAVYNELAKYDLIESTKEDRKLLFLVKDGEYIDFKFFIKDEKAEVPSNIDAKSMLDLSIKEGFIYNWRSELYK